MNSEDVVLKKNFLPEGRRTSVYIIFDTHFFFTTKKNTPFLCLSLTHA